MMAVVASPIGISVEFPDLTTFRLLEPAANLTTYRAADRWFELSLSAFEPSCLFIVNDSVFLHPVAWPCQHSIFEWLDDGFVFYEACCLRFANLVWASSSAAAGSWFGSIPDRAIRQHA